MSLTFMTTSKFGKNSQSEVKCTFFPNVFLYNLENEYVLTDSKIILYYNVINYIKINGR
jgi:hypothetical protein